MPRFNEPVPFSVAFPDTASDPNDFGELVAVNCPHCGAAHRQEAKMVQFFGPAACDTCIEGYDRRKDEEAAAEARQEFLSVWEQICPTEFRKEINPKAKGFNYDAFLTALNWTPNSGRGLLLVGDTGKGKTRAMWKIIEREWMAGSKVHVFCLNDFAHAIADAARNGKEKQFHRHLQDDVDIVVFDDLGNGRLTPTVESELLHVINQRVNFNLPIIVTTQHNGAKLTGGISDDGDKIPGKFKDQDTARAVVRRLRKHCDTVTFGFNAVAAEQGGLAL